MASPSPKPRGTSRSSNPPPPDKEVVDPIWLIRAIGITLIAALVCGYLSVCLLFYQGQWQLVLHPSRPSSPPAAINGDPIQIVKFGVDESASPQLTGWLLPALSGARYAGYTVLYLPGGDGSLADSLPTLAALHAVGINLFAVDYRGYGQSAAIHPSQRRISEDATSALQFLTVSRAVPPGRIVLFGDGIGAAIAARLALRHPEIPAVIFDRPRPDILDIVLADPRGKLLPVRALFHDRFDIDGPLASLKTPKLFLLDEIATPGLGHTADQRQTMLTIAADPKRSIHLSVADRSGTGYSQQIDRFLDEYLR